MQRRPDSAGDKSGGSGREMAAGASRVPVSRLVCRANAGAREDCSPSRCTDAFVMCGVSANLAGDEVAPVWCLRGQL